MAGLLGNGYDDPRSAANMALAAGLLQGNMGAGLLGANNAYGEAKNDALKRQLVQAQMENMQSEAAQRNALLQAAQRKQAALPGLFQGGGMTGGQPMPQTDGGVPMFSRPIGAAPMQQQPAGLNVQAALQAGYSPDEIQKLDGLRNVGLNKVARTVKATGPDGKEYEYQMDDFGRPVGAPLQQYRAPISVNRGNSQDFLDPYSLQPKASLKTFQSPDSVASNAVTMRGQNMTDARARATAEMGGIPSGYRRVGNGLEFIPGGPADPNTPKSKANLTEDQGKATGWLVQAENAYKNMLASGFDKDAAGNLAAKSAARPGLNDALERIPVVGGMANVLRSDDRQKFMQASSSLSEALLRAATGAGVNAEEARQKIQELTPRFGESDAATEQKMAAIPLYLESLRVRAGPGAVKADAISHQPTTTSAGADWRFENGKLVKVK